VVTEPARESPRRAAAVSPRRRGPRWDRIAAATTALVIAAVAVGLGLGGRSSAATEDAVPLAQPGITAAAADEIPPAYLRLYRRFGRETNIDWRFLAAIGAQESDHGRAPGARTVNASGCVGPMQLGVGGDCGDFVGRWGVDGNRDGRIEPLNPADAIATAARGLRDGKGAPALGGAYADYHQAACGYYGACADSVADYADEVMARAERYGFPTTP
jgi:hypothetical protein